MTPHTILFLAANPTGTARLAVDREAREIQSELARSGGRARFELVTRWAAEPLDLLRELRRLRPTVVHYSGHGRRGGLCFQASGGRPTIVSSAAIAETFGAAGASVKVVVLSACYRKAQADALLAHVHCVVGLSGSIPAVARSSFAIGFYGGLGESESIAVAYRQGKAAISLEGLRDGESLRLQVRDGVDAGKLVLADEMLADEKPAATSTDCDAPPPAAGIAQNRPSPDGPIEGSIDIEATAPRESQTEKRPTMALSANTSSNVSITETAPPLGRTRSRARCTIVIKASIADFDEGLLAQTLTLLRQLTSDLSLQITDIKEGSVRLMVDLSADAADILNELHESGQLPEIFGFAVKAISMLPSVEEEARALARDERSAEHSADQAVQQGLSESANRLKIGAQSTRAVKTNAASSRAAKHLVETHYPRVSNYVSRLLHARRQQNYSAEDARDITQQVFLWAIRTLKEKGLHAPIANRLRVIANSHCADHFSTSRYSTNR
jgi:hypothetical protein